MNTEKITPESSTETQTPVAVPIMNEPVLENRPLVFEPLNDAAGIQAASLLADASVRREALNQAWKKYQHDVYAQESRPTQDHWKGMFEEITAELNREHAAASDGLDALAVALLARRQKWSYRFVHWVLSFGHVADVIFYENAHDCPARTRFVRWILGFGKL